MVVGHLELEGVLGHKVGVLRLQSVVFPLKKKKKTKNLCFVSSSCEARGYTPSGGSDGALRAVAVCHPW